VCIDVCVSDKRAEGMRVESNSSGDKISSRTFIFIIKHIYYPKIKTNTVFFYEILK
jgi:hypothetical protein